MKWKIEPGGHLDAFGTFLGQGIFFGWALFFLICRLFFCFRNLRVESAGLQLGHQVGDPLGHLTCHLSSNGQSIVHGRFHGAEFSLLLRF